MLTTEDVLEELGLDEQGDYDADEPMMPGSDDEFSDLEEDVYLEDIQWFAELLSCSGSSGSWLLSVLWS